MYAVIGGAGEVGFHLARSLYDEGYNLAIIDSDPRSCERAETFDALIVRGNAASAKKLEEAGISAADLFIGVTGSDEINIIACAIASKYSTKTIARVNSLDYIDEPVTTKNFEHLGIDVAICPDLMASMKMAHMLRMPSILDSEVFARGKLQVIEDSVLIDSPVAGKYIKEIPFPDECDLVVIFREGEVVIPHGSDQLLPGDRVVMTLIDRNKAVAIRKLFGSRRESQTSEEVRKVMIYGATRIGKHLARLLEEVNDVVLLEEDPERSQIASEELLGTLVIQGSGTDENLLVDEGIRDVDAFVATTDREGRNILSCVLAKQGGARRTVALMDRPELKIPLENTGIDFVVSPRLATVSGILQHVHHTKLLSLAVLNRGEARILEVSVQPNSKVAGKKVKRLGLPKDTVVGAIVRKDRVIIPHGDHEVQAGDSLVVFAKNEAVSKLLKRF